MALGTLFPVRRATIKDIAKAAGVSPGAVSFALNDRPGVSDETRARIKAVAAELGWTRSAAAVALSAQRSMAIGLVVHHHSQDDYGESFIIRLVAGVEEVLKTRGQSLVFRLAGDQTEELETYRAWAGERRVDGVLLLRPVVDDPRPALLRELGLAAVAIGGPGDGASIASVSPDDAGKSRMLVDHLVGQGHTRLAYVTGPVERLEVRARSASFMGAGWLASVLTEVVNLPAPDEAAAKAAVDELLDAPQRPTALLCDNELLALGASASCHDRGLRIGHDIALVCFEDSPAIRMLRPAVTAIRRDPANLGRHGAESLLAVIDGKQTEAYTGPLPQLVVRESSARALSA